MLSSRRAVKSRDKGPFPLDTHILHSDSMGMVRRCPKRLDLALKVAIGPVAGLLIDT